MYNNQRIIKELKPYIPAADIFHILRERSRVCFLDSSLVNDLGQYYLYRKSSLSQTGKRRRHIYS